MMLVILTLINLQKDYYKINELLNNAASEFGQELSKQIAIGTNPDGTIEYETVTAKSTEALALAVEQAQEKAKANILADKIGESLEKVFDDMDFAHWGEEMAKGFKRGMSGNFSPEGSVTGEQVQNVAFKTDTRE